MISKSNDSRENFLEDIKDLFDKSDSFHSAIPTSNEHKHIEDYIRDYAMFSAIIDNIGLRFKLIDTTKNANDIIKNFVSRIRSLQLKARSIHLSNVYEETSSSFSKNDIVYNTLFEATEKDVSIIIENISNIRIVLLETHEIEEQHRLRLLNKLDSLQSEFHRSISRVDVFLAFILDLGDTIGGFGKKIEPAIESAERIKKLIYGKQEGQRQLPPPPKGLPAPDKESDEPES